MESIGADSGPVRERTQTSKKRLRAGGAAIKPLQNVRPSEQGGLGMLEAHAIKTTVRARK
jgi:hypothetical protein